MILVVAVALAVLTFVFIAYPAFRQEVVQAAPKSDDRLQELNSKRETTYSMLKELEFDHQSGILADEDYQDLEQRYRRKAVTILKDIDAARIAPESDLEEPVEELGVEDEIERELARMRGPRGRYCSSCGARATSSAKFCPECGKAIGQGGKA